MDALCLDPRYSETPPELLGVYGFAGGGLVEVPYRHFFELRHLKKIVRFQKTMNVLELGSGGGRWALSLAPLVNQYTAVEMSSKAVEAARNLASARKIANVAFVEQSVVEFKGDRFYDVIYFGSVTQYIENEQIDEVLNNLSPWIKPSTIIVERCTIKKTARQVRNDENGYHAIYRTSAELDTIFKKHGFSLCYSGLSYRFLRTGGTLFRFDSKRTISNLVRAMAPISFYLMLGVSIFLDVIRPIKRDWSHDFFLFKKQSKSE